MNSASDNLSHSSGGNDLPESYQRIKSQVEDRLLQRILLECLAAATPVELPGGEGIRICDILKEYEQLSFRDIVPTRESLLDRHPELDAAILRFFDDPCPEHGLSE